MEVIWSQWHHSQVWDSDSDAWCSWRKKRLVNWFSMSSSEYWQALGVSNKPTTLIHEGFLPHVSQQVPVVMFRLENHIIIMSQLFSFFFFFLGQIVWVKMRTRELENKSLKSINGKMKCFQFSSWKSDAYTILRNRICDKWNDLDE